MTDEALVLHLPLKSGSAIPTRDQRDWVTSAELIDDTDISNRQMDYWTRTGLLTPLEAATPGSGYLRRYHIAQVDRARALHDLVTAGVSLQTCRLVIDEITETGRASLGHLTLTYHPTGGAA